MTLHTLQQLTSGELKGYTLVKISAELTEFPDALFTLADSLETLDLSQNKLSTLPDDFDQFKKLKVLFLSDNLFTALPKVLAKCPSLTMIGFKANQISEIAENSLPLITRWLILTDNKITTLPNSIGELKHLEKLMLAGNHLSELPSTMQHCKNLALVRLAANKLTRLPDWLLTLPKLAWLAFSGNPVVQRSEHAKTNLNEPSVPTITINELTLLDIIGQGASGIIHKAQWHNPSKKIEHTDVAVKIYKGEVTSDGYPIDELTLCLQAGQHPNLITNLAKITQGKPLALVMALIPAHFINLGLPPSLTTCSRDTFDEGLSLTQATSLNLIKQLADVLAHLHKQRLSHGDVYAHNVLFEPGDKHKNALIFGDFGASSNLQPLPEHQQLIIEKIEVKAFGFFIEDMLSITATQLNSVNTSLLALQSSCCDDNHVKRPTFNQITQQLSALTTP